MNRGLADEGRHVLRRAFNVFDRDMTARLKPDELIALLRHLHPEVAAKEVRAVVKTVQERDFHQGKLSEDEFVACFPDIEAMLSRLPSRGKGSSAKLTTGVTVSTTAVAKPMLDTEA